MGKVLDGRESVLGMGRKGGENWRHAWSSPIMVDTRSADDSTDGIFGSDGVGKPFQDYNANTLSTTVPVGTRVKGEAPAIGTKKPHLVHGKHSVWRQDQV